VFVIDRGFVPHQKAHSQEGTGDGNPRAVPHRVILSPFACHSEQGEESLHYAQDKFREESLLLYI
jgi:hypothetical protein